MSLSSLAIITAQGNRDWVTLPICSTRTFFGIGALVRTDAGIESPADLKGKRRRRQRVPADGGTVGAGLLPARVRRRPRGCRVVDGAHAGAEPRRRDRLRGRRPASRCTTWTRRRARTSAGMMANGELDAIYVYFYGGGWHQPEHAGPARP